MHHYSNETLSAGEVVGAPEIIKPEGGFQQGRLWEALK